MSKQLESKLAELSAEHDVMRAQLARLLACPKIMHYVTTFEAEQRAAELANAEEERRAAERAKAEAVLRRSCESEAGRWRAIKLAPEAAGCVSVDYDLGALGKGRAAPGAVVKNLRNVDLESRLKQDRVLAYALATGAVVIEDIEIDRAIRLERADRAQLR